MEDNVLTPMELFKSTYRDMYDGLGYRKYTLDKCNAEWLECIAYSLAVIAEKL